MLFTTRIRLIIDALKYFETRPVCESINMDKYVAIYNMYKFLKFVNGNETN